MAEQNIREVSLAVLAGSSDITQGMFVVFEATNGIALPDAAGDAAKIAGIIRHDYDDSEADLGNESATVSVGEIMGVAEVLSGEALTVGAEIMAGNNGKAMIATTTAGTNITAGEYQVLGVVTIASGAANQYATCQLFRGRSLTAV